MDKLEHSECASAILPVKDALEVLGGKWKLQVIIALSFGAKRFREISREVGGITDKMLSKELKDLECNQLVKRTVHDAFPPIVEYDLTAHGQSLHKLIGELKAWGDLHRKVVLGK
ncbi:winged helix-turn-helix transcriptional regulator [Parapedobacter koreensis]|nr:helix-turn-helix domain-containing protein [Parapedobacter koreensis]